MNLTWQVQILFLKVTYIDSFIVLKIYNAYTVIPQSFSVSLELWQNWIDNRLTYPNWTGEMFQVLDSTWLDKIWNPKLYFINSVDGKLDNIITPSSFFWLSQNLRIYYCCRYVYVTKKIRFHTLMFQ